MVAYEQQQELEHLFYNLKLSDIMPHRIGQDRSTLGRQNATNPKSLIEALAHVCSEKKNIRILEIFMPTNSLAEVDCLASCNTAIAIPQKALAEA
eukprot:1088452-Pelagomonas_calceolata.AAC.1